MTEIGMDDLISRAAAIDALKQAAYWYDGERKIAELPAVDAVPVVRCKDCMYWKSDMLTHFWKPCDVIKTDIDWYCPCGKRR